MGRRKKEPESAHREAIASAAERLFLQRGLEAATMDDIAREAGYSKATLYVYFTNKEEIVGFLVLKSLNMLNSCIAGAVSGAVTAKGRYDGICGALTQYQERYPLYFTLALGEIRVAPEDIDSSPLARETFEVGEQINREIETFILEGIRSGELRPDIPVMQTVFLFWGALAGIIQMAANKKIYIENTMNWSDRQFLEFGFDSLYGMIAVEGRE